MPLEKKRKWFFSVHFKLLSIYFVIVFVMLVIILGIFPTIFQTYLLERSQDDLLSTKQIIQETLEETNFINSESMKDKLDAVARAKDIEIWICMEPETTLDGSTVVPVLRLGSNSDSRQLELSQDSASFIERVRSGLEQEEVYTDQFEEYYNSRTMTLAYTTGYYAQHQIGQSVELALPATAVVLLNISLQDISQSVQTTLVVILAVFGIISLLVAIMIWLLASSIVNPVNQMREIAVAIAQGDFSKKAEVYSHDEIAALANAFNRMAEELQEVESNRQAFIANISHDFRWHPS